MQGEIQSKKLENMGRELDLRERLEACVNVVRQTREFWDHRPFIERSAPWETSRPELSRWLRQLKTEQIDRFESGIITTGPLRHLCEQVSQVSHIATLSDAPGRVPQWRRIKARKRDQIHWFRRALIGHFRAHSVHCLVDWCGGKGHLSRVLSADGQQAVTVVDTNARLLAQATELYGASTTWVTTCQADVSERALRLPNDAGLVGLHACGSLTDNAIRSAVDSSCRWLAVVPCCHHKAPSTGWRPMSQTLRELGVQLSPNGLRLTIADEVTASPKLRARRRRRMVWRVGADLLLREATGVDQWHPLQELPMSAYGLDYAEYCAAALAAKGLSLPRGWQATAHRQQAQQTLRIGRALSLPRGVVRPALETLCVLDRARWLQESGWQVEVMRFCPAHVTPRNLLIFARPRP
ncbi:MAG TPA: hypothetical protein DCQ06_07455 [Myxococcales bacterium]|nr:hypothetical protein [Myxococcales bacterium]HAN31418.1 hypothetical protein [Myxococcales bacterium]